MRIRLPVIACVPVRTALAVLLLSAVAAIWLAYFIPDPALSSSLPTVHLFMEQADFDRLNANVGSDSYHPARFVDEEGIVYDGVEARYRGQNSRGWRKHHWKIRFNDGNLFRDQRVINLQSSFGDKSFMREALSYRMHRDAGGFYLNTRHVRMQFNGQYYGIYIEMENPGARALRRNGLDGDGALYKSFNQANTSGGVSKETRLDENNSDLASFIGSVNQFPFPMTTQAQRDTMERFLFDNVSVPRQINYQAVSSIIHENDQVAKGYFYYRDTERTGQWWYLPWDKDLTWGRNAVCCEFTSPGGGGVLNDNIWWGQTRRERFGHPFFGSQNYQKVDNLWNRLIDRTYDVPRIRTMYLRRLRTLVDTLLTPAHVYPWLDAMEGTLFDRLIVAAIDSKVITYKKSRTGAK